MNKETQKNSFEQNWTYDPFLNVFHEKDHVWELTGEQKVTRLTQNSSHNSGDHLRNVDFAFEFDSLQLIFKNQHVSLVVVVWTRRQWYKLVVLWDFFENTWLENLILEECTNNYACFWIVFVQFRDFLERMFFAWNWMSLWVAWSFSCDQHLPNCFRAFVLSNSLKDRSLVA